MSIPCEKVATIEAIMSRLNECEKNIIRIDTKIDGFEKALKDIKEMILGVNKKLEKGQWWIMGLMATIIVTFVLEKLV